MVLAWTVLNLFNFLARGSLKSPPVWIGFNPMQHCCPTSQRCWMLLTCCIPLHTLLHVRCCVSLGVVAQSLKPVKLLATYKRTQQLPTWGSRLAVHLWRNRGREWNKQGGRKSTKRGKWGQLELKWISLFGPLVDSLEQHFLKPL